MFNFYEPTDNALTILTTEMRGLLEATTATGKGVIIERDFNFKVLM